MLAVPAAVIANKVIATDSAGKALTDAVGVVGALFSAHTSKYTSCPYMFCRLKGCYILPVTALQFFHPCNLLYHPYHLYQLAGLPPYHFCKSSKAHWHASQVCVCQASCVGSLVFHVTSTLAPVCRAGAFTKSGALAGQVLINVVRTITSLQIAGGQLAAAGFETVFGPLVDKIR